MESCRKILSELESSILLAGSQFGIFFSALAMPRCPALYIINVQNVVEHSKCCSFLYRESGWSAKIREIILNARYDINGASPATDIGCICSHIK
jgi:hypothetical protein